MTRGLLAVIVVVEVVFAGACALAMAALSAFATGYGQRAMNWHGPVPDRTPEEQAAVDAAARGAFGATFAVMLGAQLLLTLGFLALFRYARSQRGPSSPKPVAVTFLTASWMYSMFATVPLALWTYLRSSSVDYLYLGAQLVASAVGLWFSSIPRTVSRVAVGCCVALLCVTSCLTSPFWGPALLIWPAAAVLLLSNDALRQYLGSFDGTSGGQSNR